MASGSMGSPHSKSKRVTSAPKASAISMKRSPKEPAVAATTLSPGDSVLTSEASRAPVPEAVRMNKSLDVMKTCLSWAVTFVISSSNSGPRWLIIGLPMASTMSSGMGVGPGGAQVLGLHSQHVTSLKVLTRREADALRCLPAGPPEPLMTPHPAGRVEFRKGNADFPL